MNTSKVAVIARHARDLICYHFGVDESDII